MNFTKIFVIESQRPDIIRPQESLDNKLLKSINECPLVIASFLLSERREPQETRSSRQIEILKNIDKKGVCGTLGEMEIQRLCKN